MDKKSLMSGISVPVLTPYYGDGSINYDEYGRLLQHITAQGVKGIFVCGTSGEFINLTLQERKMLLTKTRAVCGGDVSVMFNVTAMNMEELKDLSDWALLEGADAVSVTAPYYHKYDRESLVAYFKTVSELNGELPLYLYNIPGFTQNPITPAILKDVVSQCNNIKGIKDSSMDMMLLLEYQAAVEDETFELITGNDAQVLSALQAGACGGLVVMANLFPGLFVDIYQSFLAGDLDRAKQIQTRLLKFRNLCREIMPIISHKKVLDMQGFEMGLSRFPFRNLTGEEDQRIETAVRELQLL